jgi:hypothetical protein
MRKKLLSALMFLAIAPVLSTFIFPNVKAQTGSDPWWNSSWKYRRQVTIDNAAGGSLADFQVKIVVPYVSSMQPDFRDLRFTDSASVSLLPYWIEKVEAGPVPPPSYADRITEAAEWIFRGQDVNGPFFRGYGGGVPYWSTASGWYGTDYQEVTGYIIPTILDLYQSNGNVTYRDRALSMADWEVSVQNPDGNFIGYIFDTGMALQGLLAAYRVSGNPAHLDAANKAANWIILHQLPDGSYGNTAYGSVNDPGQTYHARVDWIMLDLYQTTGNTTQRDAALNNLAWVYSRQQPNGYWDQSFFHFIDYIIQGVLESGVLMQTIDGGAYATLGATYISSARKAADALLAQQLSDGSMSGGSYDSNWNPTDGTNFLSADAQISTIWARLYQLTGNSTYLARAQRMNVFLMSTQDVQTANLAIRGGIDSTWPLSGTKLSWATKFFIDALMNTPEPPPPPPSTPQATLWIKVPSLPAGGSQTVYMYYGNPTASSASDGNAVFDFFDDFSGDLSKWTIVGGTWTIENGELSASTTAFGQRLRANGITFGNGIVEARMEWISGTYFEQGLCIRGQTDEAANSYVYFLSTWSAEKHRIYKRLGSSSIMIAAGDGPNPSQSVWYDIMVSASGNFFAAASYPTYGDISGTDSSFSSGTFCLFSWSASAEHVHYDNVRIRKYAFPEPITTLGSEERVPWTITFKATGVTVPVTVSYTYDSTTGSITIPVDESVSITVPDGSTLSYVYPSPVSGVSGVRYVLTAVNPSSPQTVNGPLTITGTYKTQYLLTVLTNPSGLTPQPTRSPAGESGPANSWWYDASTNVLLTAQSVIGYAFINWDVDSVPQGAGVVSITVNMNAAHTATAHYQAIPPTASVQTATGTGTTTFTPDAGYMDELAAVSEASLPTTGKPNVAFPHGFFSFKVKGLSNGQTVTITITLPSNMPVGTQYWKYQSGKGWYQIPIGDDDGDNVITIQLTDGGLGDADGIANGIIVDPGGPGSPLPVGGVWVPINKFELLVPCIGYVSVIAVAAASLVLVKRRKKQQN